MVIGKSSSWINATRKLAIYLRDDFKCVYCTRSLHDVDPNYVTLDHIITKWQYKQWSIDAQQSFGSINATSNLITSCKSCNSSRKITSIETYALTHGPNTMARIKYQISLPLNMALAKSIMDAN